VWDGVEIKTVSEKRRELPDICKSQFYFDNKNYLLNKEDVNA